MNQKLQKSTFILLSLLILTISIISSESIANSPMTTHNEKSMPITIKEQIQPAYQILGRKQFPIPIHDIKSRIKRAIETEGDRKPKLHPAGSPFVRDTFPVDDATLSIDLSDRNRIWSNSLFGHNKPRLFLSGKPEGKTIVFSEGGRIPKFMQDRHLMNTNLLSALRELNHRLKSSKWNSFPLISEVTIPQEVLGNYLLDLLMERPSKERSQSLKTNILTEEMILPLIWDEHVASKYMGKQTSKMPFKRTFLSQSWKPGGLPGLPSIPAQRNSNPKQGKPNPYRPQYSMSVLGPSGWRPGRKRSLNKLSRIYTSDEVGDIGDFYNESPKMTKEMVSLHISSSQNSPNSIDKPNRDINMQLKKDVLLNKDWDELKRPLMEKLEGKTSRRNKKDDWKMRSDERETTI